MVADGPAQGVFANPEVLDGPRANRYGTDSNRLIGAGGESRNRLRKGTSPEIGADRLAPPSVRQKISVPGAIGRFPAIPRWRKVDMLATGDGLQK